MAAVRVSRAERYRQIRDLRAQGLTYRQVADQLGIAASTVNSVLNDPDGSKERARKRSYAGVCRQCGGPTTGSEGRENAPTVCRWCFQGKQRPANAIRLCVPIRLVDLPLDIRLEGAREAARVEPDPDERNEILLAAIMPSDRVYWVAESARPIIERLAA